MKIHLVVHKKNMCIEKNRKITVQSPQHIILLLSVNLFSEILSRNQTSFSFINRCWNGWLLSILPWWREIVVQISNMFSSRRWHITIFKFWWPWLTSYSCNTLISVYNEEINQNLAQSYLLHRKLIKCESK